METRPKKVCVFNRSWTPVWLDLRKDETRENSYKVTSMGQTRSEKGLDQGSGEGLQKREEI